MPWWLWLVTGLMAVVVGVLPAPTSAYADTGGYPDAVDCSATFGQYSWCEGNPPHPNSTRGYGYRNCTDWAAYRASLLTGLSVPANLGNANTWDDRAPSSWTVDTTPEPADIAQSDAGTFGHLGVVEAYTTNSLGAVTSITVSQYNETANGTYTSKTYTPDRNGTFWRDAGHTKKWDHFLDLNGTGLGVNGQSLATTPPPSGQGPGVGATGTYKGSDRLVVNQPIYQNQYIESPDGQFVLMMQADGNLVLYRPGYHPTWASNTAGTGRRCGKSSGVW